VTTVDVRPPQAGLRITAASWAEIVAVVDLCGPQALAARFLGAVAPPRAEVLARLARTFDEGVTLVASVSAPVPGPASGPGPAGLFGVHPDGARRAELCALVADGHQGRGVGAALLAAVLSAPRYRAWTLHAVVGHGNLAAHGLVRAAARQAPVTRHLFADGVEYVLHPRGSA
jgi:GNAT superfamily N-acetyltransferase